MILHVLIAMVAGWLQQHQQQVIIYLMEENRVLQAELGGRRLRLTDTERRRLAALAHPLGRKRLKEIATLATPDTLLRWYVLHVLMLPFVIVIFMAVHFWRVRKDGGLSGPL